MKTAQNVFLFTLLLIFASILELNAQTEFKTYPNDLLKMKEVVLDNGMKVYLIENHNKPEIYGAFVINVGSKNDPKDNTGMAHYLEHMLFKGTTKMGTIDYEKEKIYLDKINELYDQLAQTKEEKKRLEIQKQISEASKAASEYALPNEFDRIIAEMGGTGLNAFTSTDMTVYHNTLPPNELEKWLEVYVHRFEEPIFRLFQSELETVYEEKNRMLNNPIGYLIRQFQVNMFKGHPYGDQSTLGKTEHLKNPSLTAMYAYFHKYYVANNMALVLVGDFNSEEAMLIIKEKLSRFPKSNLIKEENFTIEPLKGRKEITLKSSPVKMAVYGYRIEGENKLNRSKLDLLSAVLSNDAETGLIDQLYTESKVMQAQVFDFTMEEHGALAILNVPKLVGQSFEKAEVLLFAQLDSLKQGKFSDQMFEAVKNELLKMKKLEAEDNDYIAYDVFNNYVAVEDWNKFVNYEKELSQLTKQDIVDYAKQVFGDDYLVLFSKMGKTKMEKLPKPPFKPVPSKNNQKSSYYDVLDKITETMQAIDYVNFEEDVKTEELDKNVKLSIVNNPKNNIFSLEFKWNRGTYVSPNLSPTVDYLNLVGTKDKEFKVFRSQMQALNASYYFSVNEKEIELYIDGEDEKLAETLALMNEFLLTPQNDKSKIKEIAQQAKAEAKEVKSSPSSVVRVVREYALYKKESKYLTKLSAKEIAKLTPTYFTKVFADVQNLQQLKINYVGNNKNVKQELAKYFPPKFNKVDESVKNNYLEKKPTYASKNTIYFINDKKATQTNIYFDIDLSNIPIEEHYKLYAFNEYFGRGMSSLVFQEIREFRSLAYSAYGMARVGETPYKNETFAGFIGCQNDKTIEALTTMLWLIDSMPQKPERLDYIKGAITKSAITAKPGFRNLGNQVDKWEEQGYMQDPNYKFREEFKNLKFDDIMDFYNQYLKGKPVTISIVGDKKRVNFKGLSTFGKVIELKVKDIYVD